MRTPLPDHLSRKPIDVEGVSWRLGLTPARSEITFDGAAAGTLSRRQIVSIGPGGRVSVTAYHAEAIIRGHRVVAVAASFAGVSKALAGKVEEVFRRHVPPRDWPPLILMATPDEVEQIRAGRRETLYYPWSARYSEVSCFCGRAAEVWSANGPCLHLTLVGAARYSPDQMAATSPRLRRRHPKATAFAAVALNLETLRDPVGAVTDGDAQTAG